MNNLELTPTAITPYVLCDVKEHKIVFEGRAIPEDATDFFKPIENWLFQYWQLHIPLHVDFKLEYFNTAISRLFAKMVTQLNEMHATGSSVTLSWYYDEDDDDMLDQGKAVTHYASFLVNFVPVTPEVDDSQRFAPLI